ncbi:MAG: hypothetical protein J4F32_01910 [Dehalococcoidia bacterium]|nr:hypothetical protein [Dehalococcoidia bacterium]
MLAHEFDLRLVLYIIFYNQKKDYALAGLSFVSLNKVKEDLGGHVLADKLVDKDVSIICAEIAFIFCFSDKKMVRTLQNDVNLRIAKIVVAVRLVSFVVYCAIAGFNSLNSAL